MAPSALLRHNYHIKQLLFRCQSNQQLDVRHILFPPAVVHYLFTAIVDNSRQYESSEINWPRL